MAKYSKTISTKLLQTARLHRTQAASMLGEIGLYPGQETILKLLKKGKALSMTALAKALNVRPPTVTKMVNRLEAQKLVTRVRKKNTRMIKVQLTKLGIERAGEINRIWRKLDKMTLKGFQTKEKRRFGKLLKKMSVNLERLNRGTPTSEELAQSLED